MFLEISQNSQENACARVSYFEIKIPSMQKQNTFLHRTPLVAASENKKGIYAEATVQGFFIKGVMRNFVEFTRKHFKLCRSAASLKTRP